MILFSNTETKFERIVLSLVIALIFLIVTCTNSAFSQQDQEATSTIGVKITSPSIGQQVPVGELTISGISTDNATTDCTVYADWNDQKPFQKAMATGPGGVNDYSTWNFTYTKNYNLITNGTNNLTSKLSCLSSPTNVTKWNSVNVTGEVDLTISKNNVTAGDQRTSFGGGNATSIENETGNITDLSQVNTSLSNAPNNDNATTAVPNNKTGNPIIDFFKGMFGS
ncbi:MAG TPA: hypothetical protein VE244_05395 [Nitrososphaeraceae archaeon]|nr:hypothetical protein [Nitrososphaeraceae archaeon]